MTADRPDLKFHHAGISVPDLESSIAWYREMLGFDVADRITIDAIPAKVAMLKRGPLRIELFEVPAPTPAHEDRRHPNRDAHTLGNKHVAFAIKDLDAMIAELKERGADIVFAARMPFGAFCFIRDNAGTLIEFVEQADLFEGRAR